MSYVLAMPVTVETSLAGISKVMMYRNMVTKRFPVSILFGIVKQLCLAVLYFGDFSGSCKKR